MDCFVYITVFFLIIIIYKLIEVLIIALICVNMDIRTRQWTIMIDWDSENSILLPWKIVQQINISHINYF